MIFQRTYVTGVNKGSPHDFYPRYTKRDIVLVRRVKFHNEPGRNQA